uniref:Major facilitator superfamily (MFS) profile domain-containing protein n=1 Tax=Electrophorus electricus TaxID=8005 RepID=A0A4W4F606_ELEEL
MDSCQNRTGRSTEMTRKEQQSIDLKFGQNESSTHKIDTQSVATMENNASNMSTRQNSFFPDGGYGWLVVFAATWCNGSIFAIQNSFSILHVMLKVFFADYRAKDTWIGALSMGMVFLCSPLVSMSTDRFGCRATAVGGSLVAFVGLLTGSFAKSLPLQYLTYGLLFGAGCSYSLQPTLVILGQYFQRHLGLANGLVTAGSSLFSVALPVLLEEVLVPLGLERTFQILSVLPLTQAALLGATFRPPPTPECHENTFSGIRIFCVPSYRMWAFGVAIAVLGYFVPYVHLMSFVQEQFEDSEQKEWILLVCIGASSGVGRLVFGHVGDLLPGLNKIYLQAVSFMFLGLASILVPQCLTFEGLVVVCVLLGVCDGCLLTLMAPVAFEVLGVQRASQGIGYLLGLMALPMTAGPPLAGLLHDQLGNYCLAFYLAGVPPLIGGLLLLFIPRMHHHLWASRAEMLPGLYGTKVRAEDSLPSQNIFTDGEPSLNKNEITQL